MNNYKLIACDLDGTLIGSDFKVSGQNKKAIKELTDMGIIFVPTTGRTLCEMKEVYDIPEVRYIIYSNGAAIYDKATDKTMLFGLDGNHSRFIYDTVEKFKTISIVHKDGKTFCDSKKAKRLFEYKLNNWVEGAVINYCTATENIEKVFDDGNMECVAIFFANEQDVEKCGDILKTNPDLYMVQSWNRNLEVFYKTAGKGNALKYLTEKLNIKMENVVSVGDSDNDVQMTLLSGLGLATSNACDKLKGVADGLICSNDEHVMSYIKQKIFNA